MCIWNSHGLDLFKRGIMYLYKDERRDIRSNIPLCLKEFPRAKPEGTPEGIGLYLTKLSPNTDIIPFFYNPNKNV